ncbi:hypothetical protein SGUI_1889 [Serinicoccus hydrothermalis]|uniref:Capsular polysaccharide biosynthesis protein n=1 Tax=Serinicoccus hydrothermalis TaxID=1758689 RepID=A0A1B1ND41_9MICO|nr:hypothetical protein [Serinicoccus hydrothermalis]ANS79285.1 hypothetical protein SGUI_1889 [Serinicoccus hydrothermalis]
MGRHRSARHGERPASTHALLLTGIPWVTLVLVLTLVLGGWQLLRPQTYAAQATVTATEERAADRTSVRLTEPGLAREVEAAVELGDDLRGSVDLSVRHEQADLRVHVLAQAPDPRLAVLAADTAAALTVADSPDELELVEAAEVPTEPVDRGGPGWLVLAALGLVVALWAEGVHRTWSRGGDSDSGADTGAGQPARVS